MGYDYILKGKLTLNKELSKDKLNQLKLYCKAKHSNDKSCPSDWCPYTFNSKSEIIPSGVARRNDHMDWIYFLIDKYINPLKLKVNGEITYKGQLPFDKGKITVKNNKVYNNYYKKVDYGILCESEAIAKNLGHDPATGYNYTGLDKYLKAIFPKIKDWEYKKTYAFNIDGKKEKLTPTYISRSAKKIVIYEDEKLFRNEKRFAKHNIDIGKYDCLENEYDCYFIPFYIQLNKEGMSYLFQNVTLKKELFKEKCTCLSSINKTSFEYLCEKAKEEIQLILQQYSPTIYAYTMEYLDFVDYYKK